MSLEEIKSLEGKSLSQLEDEVGRQIRLYKKETKAIRESDDPAMTVEGKQDYEIGKVRKVLESNIQALEQQYQKQGQEIIEELEEEAALSAIAPSQSDKETVSGIAEDFLYSLTMTGVEAEKLAEIGKLSAKIAHMSDEKKVVLRRRLPAIMQQMKDESQSVQRKLRSMGQGLADIKTEAELTLEAAKQDISSGGTSEYRTLLIAERISAERRREWESPGDNISGKKFEVEYKSI